MDYNQAINFIVKRRSDEVASANAFYRSLMQSNEEFRSAELKIRAAELKYADGKISKDEVLKLYRERNAIVDELGVRDRLSPKPHCSLCFDTGWTDGKICQCVKQLAIDSSSEYMAFPLHTFDDVDYSLYTDEKQRELIKSTVERLSVIIEKGAGAKTQNINLFGGAGTGKTFLASCIAGEAIARNMSVVFITAFNFVEKARQYHTTFDSSRESVLQPILDCDVLIIDDLGSEAMLNNITKEYLYLVINERQIHNRLTVITSNLTFEQISGRYGDRISSRLLTYKSVFTMYSFAFKDIRKRLS